MSDMTLSGQRQASTPCIFSNNPDVRDGPNLHKLVEEAVAYAGRQSCC